MRIIGVTGHRGLPPNTVHLVRQALRDVLAEHDASLTGVTLLADGADQIFASTILGQGGSLEVIVPAERYRDGLPATSHAEYDELISRATKVHRLDYIESTSESHMAASELMISMVSELLAVWDQRPARGHGGTADIVAHAHGRGCPVRVIWPDGAARD